MKKKISAMALMCVLPLTLAGCINPFSCITNSISSCLTKCGLMIIVPIALVIFIPIIAKLIKAFSRVRHEAKMNKMQEKAMQNAIANASKAQSGCNSNGNDNMQIF